MNQETKKIWIDPRALHLAILKVKARIPELFASGELSFREYYVARSVCSECYKEICDAIAHAEATTERM